MVRQVQPRRGEKPHLHLVKLTRPGHGYWVCSWSSGTFGVPAGWGPTPKEAYDAWARHLEIFNGSCTKPVFIESFFRRRLWGQS